MVVESNPKKEGYGNSLNRRIDQEYRVESNPKKEGYGNFEPVKLFCQFLVESNPKKEGYGNHFNHDSGNQPDCRK